LPLDGTYNWRYGYRGHAAYIIDTRNSRPARQFGGRVISGFGNRDGNARALPEAVTRTHVSGNRQWQATYGVAKNVTLVAVRVLDCRGSGHEFPA
jgi:hypothetical protein